jgi:hypothetical protein
MKAFEDPAHPGNNAVYHAGKPCAVTGCEAPAGTWWSPHWCFTHNVERIHRVSRQLEEFCAGRGIPPATAHAITSPGPVNCQIRLRFQNKSYPRTCERCGFGPCPFFDPSNGNSLLNEAGQ